MVKQNVLRSSQKHFLPLILQETEQNCSGTYWYFYHDKSEEFSMVMDMAVLMHLVLAE